MVDMRFHLRRIGLSSLIAYGPMVLIHGLCITGVIGWVIAGVELFTFVPFGALLVSVAALLLLPFPSTRREALSALVVSGSMVVLFIPALMASTELRTFGFYLAAKRAAPLIRAIEEHVRDTGAPPETLERLVPRYLPSLPARLPALELITGEKARTNYQGNDWVLFSVVSTGFINWDQFMYFPNQRYPDEGYGGWIEHIERWAYVHE